MPHMFSFERDSLSADPQPRGNIFRDIWYGRRSLGFTFWVWNVLVGWALGLGGGVLAVIVRQATGSWIGFYLLLALTIPYSIWISVGLWRTAEHTTSGWGTIVQGLVVLGALVTAFRVFQMLTMGPEEYLGLR